VHSTLREGGRRKHGTPIYGIPTTQPEQLCVSYRIERGPTGVKTLYENSLESNRLLPRPIRCQLTFSTRLVPSLFKQQPVSVRPLSLSLSLSLSPVAGCTQDSRTIVEIEIRTPVRNNPMLATMAFFAHLYVIATPSNTHPSQACPMYQMGIVPQLRALPPCLHTV
jgi:hypothetical protein